MQAAAPLAACQGAPAEDAAALGRVLQSKAWPLALPCLRAERQRATVAVLLGCPVQHPLPPHPHPATTVHTHTPHPCAHCLLTHSAALLRAPASLRPDWPRCCTARGAAELLSPVLWQACRVASWPRCLQGRPGLNCVPPPLTRP